LAFGYWNSKPSKTRVGRSRRFVILIQKSV
jgi:hypothetical protein